MSSSSRPIICNDAQPNWLDFPVDSSNIALKRTMYEAGKPIAAMMDASLESNAVPQSPFKKVEDLAQYGWEPILDPAHDPVKESDLEPLVKVDALFDTVGPMRAFRHKDWHKLLLIHSHAYKDGKGKEHPSTGAVHENLVNFRKRVVIVGAKNHSPMWVRKNVTKPKKTWNPFSKGKKPDLVPLHHFSDVLYLGLIWAVKELQIPTYAVRNIQHVFLFRCADMKMDEESAKTLPLDSIEHRSNNERWSLITWNECHPDPHSMWAKKWPGHSYPMAADGSSHQAIAALSTQAIKRVAWMLSTHKQELGVRAIDRVVIFDSPLEEPETEPEQPYPGFLYEPLVKERRNICEFFTQWCAYLHIKDGPIGFAHLSEDADPDEGPSRSLMVSE